MDESWNAAWFPLLPAGVVLRAGAILPDEPPAHPKEEAALAGATAESRIREHRAGRRFAREALRVAGVPNDPLLNGPDGAPLWPEGWLGSITHGREAAAAAVARTADVAALGIDLERVDRVKERLRKMVLSETEALALQKDWRGNEDRFTALVFSAKEAFFKAQWPVCRSHPAWKDVVISAMPNAPEFSVSAPGPSTPEGLHWLGRHAFHQGHVLTAVWLVSARGSEAQPTASRKACTV